MENKIDAFIGSTFLTPKDGVLTVVGISDRKSGSNKIYRLKCSICSEDRELFPDLFESVKGSLMKGKVPCGCSKSMKWDTTQYITRITRECIKRSYKFHGFVIEDCSVSKNTKLKLECIKDNTKWETTSIKSFLGGSGCTTCQISSLINRCTKDDKTLIDSFINSGKFHENTIFNRCQNKIDKRGKKVYWEVICPVCLSDDYVKGGVCSGTFISTLSVLRKGCSPCRCPPNYRWTKPQREFQLNKIMKEEGLTFKGWVNDYKSISSNFKWVCKNNHNCIGSLDNFINGGTRCRTCFYESNNFGYFPERANDPDFLYLLRFISPEETFLKIGRAFDIDIRIDQFPKDYSIELIAYVQNKHQWVYDTEQYMHKQAAAYHCLPTLKFGGSKLECFIPSVLDIIDIHAE